MPPSSNAVATPLPGENQIHVWKAMLKKTTRLISEGRFQEAFTIIEHILANPKVPSSLRAVATVAFGDVSLSQGYWEDASAAYGEALLLLKPYKEDERTEEKFHAFIRRVEYKSGRANAILTGGLEADPGPDRSGRGNFVPLENVEGVYDDLIEAAKRWDGDEDSISDEYEEDVVIEESRPTLICSQSSQPPLQDPAA